MAGQGEIDEADLPPEIKTRIRLFRDGWRVAQILIRDESDRPIWVVAGMKGKAAIEAREPSLREAWARAEKQATG